MNQKSKKHTRSSNNLRIGVAGFFGYGNPGDELILHNFLELHKKDQITIFNPDQTDQIPGSDIQVLYFPGGGIFHDLWIQKHFPKKIIEKIDIPMLLLAAGIPHGENKTLISHRISYFVRKLKFIGVRDPVSKQIFQSLWDLPVHLIPDLAFLTPKLQAKRSTILLQKKRRISSNYKQLTPKNYWEITEQLNQKISEEFKTKLLEWNSFKTAIKEISQAKFLISQSLHAGIIAITQQTPFSAIQYQGKILHVLSMAADSKRIFYPTGDLNPARILPFCVQPSEKWKLKRIQQFLKDITQKIHHSIEENSLEDLKIIELLFSPTKKESYSYGREYGKPHRRIINFLRNI